MQRWTRLLRLLAGVWCWSTISSSAHAATIEGTVVGVTDGDTVVVLDRAKHQYKIRLSGIDAPEQRQPFGSRSKQHLSQLVFKQPVTVEWTKHDRYGRVIGKLVVQGKDANLEQLKAGLAWHYLKYAHEQTPEDRAAYSTAESNARTARIGLWTDAAAIAPWDFRRLKAARR